MDGSSTIFYFFAITLKTVKSKASLKSLATPVYKFTTNVGYYLKSFIMQPKNVSTFVDKTRHTFRILSNVRINNKS